MPACAIAHLQDVRFGPDLATYAGVDDRFTRYGGRFLESPFVGDVVLIVWICTSVGERAWTDRSGRRAECSAWLDRGTLRMPWPRATWRGPHSRPWHASKPRAAGVTRVAVTRGRPQIRHARGVA